MIETVKYARTHNIPFLGLCYGLQMAVIEYARNVLKLDAHTTEVDPSTKHPVIHIMPDQEKLLLQKQYGGTMRLGAWPCELDVKSKAYKAYQKAGWVKKSKKALISERHRHRYEVNNDYREQLEKAGLKFSGYSPDKLLVEILELPKHKFFMATQFHPEFLSRPLTPHPLFLEFIRSLK
jgi:CTP synthase